MTRISACNYAQVLQDAGRRRQYDAARSASPSGSYAGYSSGYGGNSGGGGGGGGGFQPGVDSDDFEEAFREWWEKAGGKCVLFAAYRTFPPSNTFFATHARRAVMRA